jgi:hypothetical protein
MQLQSSFLAFLFRNRKRMSDDENDDGNRSIIMGIIDQLRKGTDLHRVSLPTFVLEPRSMCERLLDFFSFEYILHEYLFINRANQMELPEERLLHAVRYFLAGWHIRPKGVKKPFNPILGMYYWSCTQIYSKRL